MKVFVFGSNEAGIHGKGAAKFTLKEKGAQFGRCYGHVGNSFAIPTKDEDLVTLPLETIQDYVRGFVAYSQGKRKVTFQVTAIGTGLAGHDHADIAPMFKDCLRNCAFDERWRPYLGDDYSYFVSE